MANADMMVRELLRLGVYLRRVGTRVTREFGLTQQQFVVLVTILEQAPISQKDIVSDLLYKKSNVSKSVSRLKKLNLVSTRKSEEDSRVVLCEMTGQGMRVAKDCIEVLEGLNTKWLEGIWQDDLDHAWRVLRQLQPME